MGIMPHPVVQQLEPVGHVALQRAIQNTSITSLQVARRVMDEEQYARPLYPNSEAFRRDLAFRNQDHVTVSLDNQGR